MIAYSLSTLKKLNVMISIQMLLVAGIATLLMNNSV